jgi:GTP pyrophosphokinase
MLAQALRAEGIEALPTEEEKNRLLWDRLLRFSGNRSRADLLTDIGLGKRIASIVAKRLARLLEEAGVKPDPLLMSRERFTAHESVSQGALLLDGSEGSSVQFAHCCRPIPGDEIVGYLGHGEGVMVHTADCTVARRLQHRDQERFIAVEWSDEPTRAFETELMLTVTSGKGVLARVASALAAAEVNITHVQMQPETTQDTTELRFTVAVDNREHLAAVMRSLKRTPAVLKAERAQAGH